MCVVYTVSRPIPALTQPRAMQIDLIFVRSCRSWPRLPVLCCHVPPSSPLLFTRPVTTSPIIVTPYSLSPSQIDRHPHCLTPHPHRLFSYCIYSIGVAGSFGSRYCVMTSLSSLNSTGFVRYELKPASPHFCHTSSRTLALRATMGMGGWLFLRSQARMSRQVW